MKAATDADQAAALDRTTKFALACVATWVLATVCAGPLGIWLAVGFVAVALGGAMLALDGAVVRRSLLPSARRLLLGAAVGGAMVATTYLLFPVLARLAPFIATDAARLYAAFRAPPSPAVAALALVPIIVGEEIVWRGVVQGALERRFGTWRAVGGAALIYALAHAPIGSPLLVGLAFACGLAWGALRAASGSLVPTLVAHLLWDVLVLLWLPLDGR